MFDIPCENSLVKTFHKGYQHATFVAPSKEAVKTYSNVLANVIG